MQFIVLKLVINTKWYGKVIILSKELLTFHTYWRRHLIPFMDILIIPLAIPLADPLVNPLASTFITWD